MPSQRSSVVVWCLPLRCFLVFAFVCLRRMGSSQKRVLFWLAFGVKKGEFPSQRKGVPSEKLWAPKAAGVRGETFPSAPSLRGEALVDVLLPRLRGVSLGTSTVLMSVLCSSWCNSLVKWKTGITRFLLLQPVAFLCCFFFFWGGMRERLVSKVRSNLLYSSGVAVKVVSEPTVVMRDSAE